jgi:hypothetical protein
MRRVVTTLSGGAPQLSRPPYFLVPSEASILTEASILLDRFSTATGIIAEID